MTDRGKYRRLQAARPLVNVPATVYLGDDFFHAALAEFGRGDAAIAGVLDEITATSGASLDEHVAELKASLCRLSWRPDAERQLIAGLEPAFSAAEIHTLTFAVRSVAPGEDGARRSHAGLYSSVLEVRGVEALLAALLDVWKSYFSYAALLQRLAAGSLGSPARMGAMVQPMVAAEFSGVCFTADPIDARIGAVVEYVEGRGDALVSGALKPTRLEEQVIAEGKTPPRVAPALRELIAAARTLKGHFRHELDIEWSWDGKRLWILQVRPISTLPSFGAEGAPTQGVFDWLPLYEASEQEIETFAPLAGFAAYFRSKRAPLYRFAREMGADAGRAVLLRFDRAGLAMPGSFEALIAQFSSPEVVVDVSETYRQRVLAAHQVADELTTLSTATDGILQVTLRDFIRGDRGLISRTLTPNAVLCEISDKGLLALNRGTSAGRSLRLERSNLESDELGRPQAECLFFATIEAQNRFGSCQIEWVLADERLILVDYSPLDDPLPETTRKYVVSPGHAVGEVFRLHQEEALRRVSEGPAISLGAIPDAETTGVYLRDLARHLKSFSRKPILLADRPYAALATLLPYVGGFIFEHASSLCHLAILLREHEVPAIESAELYASLDPGSRFTLDTHADALFSEKSEPVLVTG